MFDPAKTSLPQSWSIPFAMTLRSRGVSGDAIGAALREVESHCAEIGQSPVDAFGDPVEYAATLAAESPAAPGEKLVSALAPTALGLAGLMLTTPTVEAWRRGTAVAVSAGLCLSFVATLLVVVALVNPQLHRRRVGLSILAILGTLVVIGAPILWTTQAFTASVPLCLALAALAVFGSTAWHRGSVDPDAITDPLARVNEHATRRRFERVFPVVTAWLFPILAVLLGLLAWFAPGRVS
ncbi:MAG TPA: hypothetical protein PLL54_01885 [Dermatophilaceae bacterium]|jgi:hypothetical protein|nr:hypothetical protein [Dermatophilaceae bacterium]